MLEVVQHLAEVRASGCPVGVQFVFKLTGDQQEGWAALPAILERQFCS